MKPLVLALPLAALAAAPAQAREERHFRTPSGRIACMMFKTSVRCDAFFLNDTAFRVTRTAPGKRIHVTDTVAVQGERKLAYGKSITFGVFTCTSRAVGLTCENGRHHGFFVSVQRQRVY